MEDAHQRAHLEERVDRGLPVRLLLVVRERDLQPEMQLHRNHEEQVGEAERHRIIADRPHRVEPAQDHCVHREEDVLHSPIEMIPQTVAAQARSQNRQAPPMPDEVKFESPAKDLPPDEAGEDRGRDHDPRICLERGGDQQNPIGEQPRNAEEEAQLGRERLLKVRVEDEFQPILERDRHEVDGERKEEESQAGQLQTG